MDISPKTEKITLFYGASETVRFQPEETIDNNAHYTLSVKAVRNPDAPAMVLASGTVSGNRVVFEVSTFTQEFRDVSLRSCKAWLEIHTADKVLLQREITVRPRTDVDGEPEPTPAKLYYTRDEVDAILSSGGYATSAAVTEIISSGGYATSGAVTEIISSGGYATSGEVPALAAPAEVVDSSSTSKTFTSIDGGTVYRFIRPLTALTISAMPADTREAVLIFSGGIAVDRTPAVSAMLPVKVWDDNDDYVDGSAALPLSATSSGWQFTADSRVWCSATAGNGDDLEIDAEMRIVSGSMTCVSSGGAYVLTADNLLFETTENVSSGEDASSSVSSAVVSGLVASSTDGAAWTIVSSAEFPYIYGDRWEGHESIGYGSGSAVSVTSALTTTTPIRVALPASAGIVSMPDFKSGETYVMSLQHGIAVGAKYEVQS